MEKYTCPECQETFFRWPKRLTQCLGCNQVYLDVGMTTYKAFPSDSEVPQIPTKEEGND